MMDMHSRNQYLKVLQMKYREASKKEKSKILNEYCENTGQHRKHVIQKINSRYFLKKAGKRGRKQIYDGYRLKWGLSPGVSKYYSLNFIS